MNRLLPPAVHRVLILLLIACLAQTSCTVNKKQNTGINTHPEMPITETAGTWWTSYQQALSLAAGGSSAQAIKDLQQAAQENNSDRWRVSTPDYTIIDYFPHRELGILYYQRQEYIKAIEQLEESLKSETSAKAIFFLDRARAAKIFRDGEDHAPPQLDLETSTAREVTSVFMKRVKGVARDDTYISSIHVADKVISLEPAEKSHVFMTDIPLEEGDNTIDVTAADLVGKTSEKQMTVFSDHQGPLIEITNAAMKGNNFSVSGRVSDRGGLASLHINGELWPITGVYEAYNFSFTLPEGSITISAVDRAANETNATLGENDFTPSGEEPGLSAEIPSPPPPSGPTDDLRETVPPEPPLPPPVDHSPPVITLDGMGMDMESYEDSITFRATISDNEKIHSLFVNTSPVFTKDAKKAYFTCLKKLAAGPNEFHFIAFDQQGNKTDRKIVVTRKIGNINQPEWRMKIGVLPFTGADIGDVRQQNIAEKLAAILTQQERFQAADQDEMQALQEESAFSKASSPPADQVQADIPPTAIDTILSGTITLSSGYGEITGQLVDAGSSETMAFHDVFGEVADQGDIDRLLKKLADAFTKDFPVTQGLIVDVNDNLTTINLGAKDGIKRHTRFIVYRASPPIIHPVTKIVIHPEPDIIGMLKVTEVQEHSAVAEIVSGGGRIRKFDEVIAR